MSQPLRPLEEMRAAERERFEANKDLPGSDGALARLALLPNWLPITLSDWLHAERRRGTTLDVSLDALAVALANAIFVAALQTEHPKIAAREVRRLMDEQIVAAFRGDVEACGVVVNEDGTQREVTVRGYLQEGRNR